MRANRLRQALPSLAFALLLAGGAEAQNGGLAFPEAFNGGDFETALDKFRDLVRAQGGDPRYVDDPRRLPRAPHRRFIRAERSGFLHRIDTRAVGTAAMILGAGRAVAADPVDPAVGITVLARIGDSIDKRQDLFEVWYRKRSQFEEARRLLSASVKIAAEPRRVPRLIRKREIRL